MIKKKCFRNKTSQENWISKYIRFLIFFFSNLNFLFVNYDLHALELFSGTIFNGTRQKDSMCCFGNLWFWLLPKNWANHRKRPNSVFLDWKDDGGSRIESGGWRLCHFGNYVHKKKGINVKGRKLPLEPRRPLYTVLVADSSSKIRRIAQKKNLSTREKTQYSFFAEKTKEKAIRRR